MMYAEHDGVELLGDLYCPRGAGPHPVLLAVPGGAWRFGQRSGLRHWAEFLAASGYAVFCIDYRQATAGKTFPQAAQDVRAAAQYICGVGAEYGLDTSRLGLLGASAGAHLAALVSLAGDRPPLVDAYPNDPYASLSPRFRVLIAAYGIYDLFTHWQATRVSNAAPGQDITERFMGCAPFDDPGLYVQASPIRHLSYKLNALKVMLIWGTHDTAVSPKQSESFLLALEQARFHVRACAVVGAGHHWFSEDPIDDPHGFTCTVAPRIARFLDRHLSPDQPVK